MAQHIAATAPHLVDKLVLIDTTPRYTDDARKMWVERAAAARRDGVAALAEGLLRIWFTEDFVAADPPAVRYVRDTLGRCSGEGYALACEALGAADLRPLARRDQGADAGDLRRAGDAALPGSGALARRHHRRRARWSGLAPPSTARSCSNPRISAARCAHF